MRCFPRKAFGTNQDTYSGYYETLSLLAAPWILTLFSCHFSLIENYRRWAMAVVPLPVPPFPAVTTQGAKRRERSTAGCRGCCNWSCRGCSRGGEEKGRRRVQVRVGGREMTNHKMCTFGIVSGYCNNLRHGCWNDDIHWYPIYIYIYLRYGFIIILPTVSASLNWVVNGMHANYVWTAAINCCNGH